MRQDILHSQLTQEQAKSVTLLPAKLGGSGDGPGGLGETVLLVSGMQC